MVSLRSSPGSRLGVLAPWPASWTPHGMAPLLCLLLLPLSTPCNCVQLTKLARTPSTAHQAGIPWCRYRFEATGRPPIPFGSDDLARISLAPLLSRAKCDALITAVVEDERGWLRDQHDRYGTSSKRLPARFQILDVVGSRPMARSQAVCDLLNEVCDIPRLAAVVHGLFGGTAGFAERVPGLHLKFARIVKYDAALGEVELGFHQDGPLITCNIALNSPDEYEGGGTILKALQQGANLDREPPAGVLRHEEGVGTAVVLPAGHALVHPGQVLHAGAPIHSGVRWLLGLFFDGAE